MSETVPVKPARRYDKRRTGEGSGGARTGAGRKPHDMAVIETTMIIRLSHELKEKILRLGGAAWLRGQAERAKEKNI